MVEATIVIVVDAVPLPTKASADLPEAARSETMRPELAGDTDIFSASTLGVVGLRPSVPM